jgi:hypothetical protein
MVRGGRLKERDPLFEIVLKWITHSEVGIVMPPYPLKLHSWLIVLQWDMTLSMREALARAETLIDQVVRKCDARDLARLKLDVPQHYENPEGSELSRKCPAIAHFYTRLPLLKVRIKHFWPCTIYLKVLNYSPAQGLDNLSNRIAVEERRFVPPTVSGGKCAWNGWWKTSDFSNRDPASL